MSQDKEKYGYKNNKGRSKFTMHTEMHSATRECRTLLTAKWKRNLGEACSTG